MIYTIPDMEHDRTLGLRTVMNSIVSKIAPGDKLARYLGFMGMMNSSGRAFGP